MVFQINFLQEIQFIAYWTAFIIGFQLAIYFFYQYFKIQDINLRLNRVLLSFGTFILSVIIGALLLVITRLYELEPFTEKILYKIGFALVLFAPIGFFSFILIEEFSKILNLKVSLILITLNIVSIIILFIVPSTDSFIFRISIIFMVLCALYCIFFQIKLINTTVGEIKKRLRQFFIGEILCLIALAFAGQVSLNFLGIGTTEITFFIGVSLLIVGFTIIFFSAIDFPPFYEFEYQLYLLKLFIINQKKNSLLYTYEFLGADKKKIPKEDKDKLMSGGLTGIEIIISAITNTQNERIKVIKQEGSYILLEYGTKYSTPIVYALLVKKDLKSIRYFLNLLKVQFENFFKEILENFEEFDLAGQDERLFSSFDIILENLIK
ncbi:MAG: hypothetical protein ACTSQJ_01905 [Promethearchaeota archaeon]